MITAIVLAAGRSSRMPGKNKMFLPFRDTTVLSNVIAELVISDVDKIIIVLDSQAYANQLDIVSKVDVCVNENPDNGLTSSIQTGIKEARAESHYLICLGDMPLISHKEYNLLINRFLNTSKTTIIQPTYQGIPGNPILFANQFRAQILSLKSPNGCRPVVTSNNEAIVDVEMPTNSIQLDIDTEEDYRIILNSIS